jgi:DNA polymerase-3 subunit chi
MPKIDFYILTTDSETERLAFACRLIEKAYKNQHRIYIHAETQTLAHTLDELLWTYREDSFLPHNLYGEGPDPAPPIQIGFAAKPEKQRDIMINLSTGIPEFFTQFARVCEVINNTPEAQAAARENYRHYRARGFEITTHKLQSVEA